MLVKLYGSFQPIHARHLKIHQNYVRERALGSAKRVFATPLGGITVEVDVLAGSTDRATTVIKNINPETFPDSLGLGVGDEIGAVGLVADERGSGYWIGQGGMFTVLGQAEPT